MSVPEIRITSSRTIEVQGSVNVPTCLYYGPKGPFFGLEALAKTSNGEVLNENFKVDLGMLPPERQTGRIRFTTAAGTSKSAAELTADFLNGVLTAADTWLAENNAEKTPAIMIAEPVSMAGDLIPQDWLQNYRDYLRRSLRGKGFSDIEFLPEPFAVFQYYRYEAKYPSLNAAAKHCALVIDFGGGTFDICIIETTKDGDIRRGGKNARPLGAASSPIGGFFLNALIAETLYRQIVAKDQAAKIGKGLDLYRRWRKEGDNVLSTAGPEYANFCCLFSRAIHEVEDPKIRLCRRITTWAIDAPLAITDRVSLIADPFGSSEERVLCTLTAEGLRDIFVNQLWPKHLKPVIQKSLTRGKEELRGQPISVVLLSGGSCNIGWLRRLLEADFSYQISGAQIFPIDDYQQVVAKGLAIECARRFYTGEGDFSAVTYNPLYVRLDPDSTGIQTLSFTPKGMVVPKNQPPGMLLSSAFPTNELENRPLRWKVKLERPPHFSLAYYFTRSLEEKAESEALNIDSHSAFTPPNAKFDSTIQLELATTGQNSVRPRFIYKTGAAGEDAVFVDGQPFCLDMTVRQESKSQVFMGLDFGTSNSSVSYVTKQAVEIQRTRSDDTPWMGLAELSNKLPYPMAEPLKRYLSQTDQSSLRFAAIEFVESVLAVGAYLSYLEYCLTKHGKSAQFSGFRQRSAGPLWGLLKNLHPQLKSRAKISSAFQDLIRHEFEVIENAVNFVSNHKHQKADDFNLHPVVVLLANAAARAFADRRLGRFEHVQKKAFSKVNEGLFRYAHGSPPFMKMQAYRGKENYSAEQVFVVDTATGHLLPLEPLIFIDRCPKHTLNEGAEPHWYIFDKFDEKHRAYSFKAVGHTCSLEIGESDPRAAIYSALGELYKGDPDITLIEENDFRDLEES